MNISEVAKEIVGSIDNWSIGEINEDRRLDDELFVRADEIEKKIVQALKTLEAEKDAEIKAVREQISILGKAKQVCERENKALREVINVADSKSILDCFNKQREETSSLRNKLDWMTADRDCWQRQNEDRNADVLRLGGVISALRKDIETFSQDILKDTGLCFFSDGKPDLDGLQILIVKEIVELRHSLEVMREALLPFTLMSPTEPYMPHDLINLVHRGKNAIASLSALSKKEMK